MKRFYVIGKDVHLLNILLPATFPFPCYNEVMWVMNWQNPPWSNYRQFQKSNGFINIWAVDENWTHDLFLTKEVLYHWATTADQTGCSNTNRDIGPLQRCPQLLHWPVVFPWGLLTSTITKNFFFWAGDRARTGHLKLGRLPLYQMSYSRKWLIIFNAKLLI